MSLLQLLINSFSLGAIYSIIALGFTLIYSILKFSNFSHGGVMVMSAYFAYMLQRSLNLGLVGTLILTAVFGALVSCVVQFVGFERLRRKKSNTMLFFVSSSTLGILLQNIIVLTYSSTYYSYPAFFKNPNLQIGSFTVSLIDIMMLSISGLVIFLLMFLLYKTRLGIAIRALSFDNQTVQLMGINVSVVIAVTFIMSGALGALAGVFCGMNYVLSPQLNMYVFKGMIASILGGLGNISGALYGALMLGMIEVFMIFLFGAGLTPVFTFLFSIVFLLVRPQGISGRIVLEKV